MINTSIGLIGLALQSAKGTAASTPEYVHGLTGGQVFKLDRTVESDDVSCGVRAGTDSHVESIVPGADFDSYGYADVLPLWCYGALGGIASAANAGSGMSGYYDHTCTLGDTLPYFTLWGRMDTVMQKVKDCKISQLEMEFEGNKPLDFGITMLGTDATLGLDSFPGSVDPSCFDGYYIPTGGTFKLDTASGTPAVAAITKGSLTLDNACAAIALAGQVTPGDIEEGKLTSSGSVTVKPDDDALYRKLLTGSASGTSVSGVMLYGSFEWTFKHSKDSKAQLFISATNVPFTCDFPDVDPAGGAAEFEFTFDNIGVAAADGSPVTIVVTNTVSSYVS